MNLKKDQTVLGQLEDALVTPGDEGRDKLR
jgi:hypothetical protein